MSYQDSNRALSLEKQGCSAAAWGSLLMFIGAVFLFVSFYQAEMLWQIFWGLIGLTLMLTGYRFRKPKANLDDNPYADLADGNADQSPQLLEQVHRTTVNKNLQGHNPDRLELIEAASPLFRGIILIVFSCIWNGVIILIAYQSLAGGLKGGFDWIGILFFIPFALIGIGLILGAVYFIMANFNQRPSIGLKPGTIPHGETARIDWSFDKPVANYYEFIIKLIGEERATYTRGTDRVTDTHKFYDEVLTSTSDFSIMQQGKLEFSIPRNLMYSWKSTNNEVQWRIEVCGKVKHWPDMNMSFPITVLPQLDHLEKSLGVSVQSSQTEVEE
jgi:uncharacterized membrane protein (DUF485 family)